MENEDIGGDEETANRTSESVGGTTTDDCNDPGVKLEKLVVDLDKKEETSLCTMA